MDSKGAFILGVARIVWSPVWIIAENVPMAIIWLCAGVIMLIMGFIKNRKER